MKRAILLLLLAVCSIAANAADILSASLRLNPAEPFANQPFDLLLEFAIPMGCEFENVSLNTVPSLDDLFGKGGFDLQKEERKQVNGQDAMVYVFRRKVKSAKPFNKTLQVMLMGVLGERARGRFFSNWRSSPKLVRLPDLQLEVIDVPAEGKPESFSGAVGEFTLSGSVSPSKVHPGDIVTLALSLKGDGDLSGIPLSFPKAVEGFKVYPAKETTRTAESLAGTQVWIPADTNATAIPQATFTYYNPKSRSYETASAGPFPLAFLSGTEVSTNVEVRVIHTTPEPSRVETALPSALRLDIVGKKLQRIEDDTQARFAPSRRAAVLFSIPKGSEVLPLERAGQWLRVDFNGRRGWICE